jgi:glycosyltransferase involved in cell wall biosynthesis
LDRNPKIEKGSIADNKGENNMATAIQIEKIDQRFPEPVIDEIASIDHTGTTIPTGIETDLNNPSVEALIKNIGGGATFNPVLQSYLASQNNMSLITRLAFNKKIENPVIFHDNYKSFLESEPIEEPDDQDGAITVLIPAYNEEVAIGSMVLHTRKYADRVIVIDDGSSDRTVEVAEMAGAEVIRHPENRGKGEALKTGFEAASQNGTKIIITMDADGQHNPDEIPKLIAHIRSGEVDMVNGSRYINGKETDTPAYRRIGQSVLDAATNLNCGINITDSQSGFRAFAVDALPSFRFKQTGFGIESEMLADAAKAGLKLKEVEIGVRYDVDCSTEHPVSHGVRVLVKVLQDMEFNKPLYYFTVPGTVMAGVGLLLGLSFLRTFYLGGSLMFGPTLFMLMLMLVGFFMAFTGIILHSISRMIWDSKMNIG